MTSAGTDDVRRAQLAENLLGVRERIARACARVHRSPEEITLVAVTKTYPAADVVRLAALGIRDIGENRDQEAADKATEVAASGVDVRWHFVGRLQRNKCRSVARYAALVHSVDSVRLATALARVAEEERDDALGVLLQISLDGDATRGGAVEATDDADIALDRVAEAVSEAPSLDLRGVMAVAPLDWEPDRAFERLAEIARKVSVRFPTAAMISAGMSADLEPAIAHGATHVRIGSLLLGQRAPLR